MEGNGAVSQPVPSPSLKSSLSLALREDHQKQIVRAFTALSESRAQLEARGAQILGRG